MRKGLVPTLVGGLFALVGVVFLSVGLAVLASTMEFLDAAERTVGTVVDIEERVDHDADSGPDESWYPVVAFEASRGERVEFVGDVGREPGAFERGERLPVAYDPTNPQDARVATTGSLYALPAIFSGLGGLFAVLGTTILVVGVRALLVRRWLLRHGTAVQGQVTYAGLDHTTTINRRHPFVVRASFQDPRTGQTYTASSDRFFRDPADVLGDATTVTVLVDPRRPTRCLVDLRPRSDAGWNGTTSRTMPQSTPPGSPPAGTPGSDIITES